VVGELKDTVSNKGEKKMIYIIMAYINIMIMLFTIVKTISIQHINKNIIIIRIGIIGFLLCNAYLLLGHY
jgi:hypothetical protein